MSFPRRGEVYWVQLDPTVGTEMGKVRPGVILSNDVGNEHSERVIVAPITTRGTQRVYPFEVLLQAGEGGLREASKVAVDQLRSVDKRRLGERIGVLAEQRIDQVNRAARIVLGL